MRASRVRMLAATVLTAVVVTTAWLFLRTEAALGRVEEHPVRTQVGEGGSEPSMARAAPVETPQPLAAGGTDQPAEVPAEPEPSGETKERPGEPVSLVGQVINLEDEPVSDATVWYVPHLATLQAWGYDVPYPWDLDAMSADELPHTTTDGSGRFRIESRGMPMVAALNDGFFDARYSPGLVVAHPDYATRQHECKGLRTGPYDAGLIRIGPGAVVLGRVVDGGGLALPGTEVRLHGYGASGRVGDEDFFNLDSIIAITHTTSDAGGRFVLRLALKADVSLSFVQPDMAPRHVRSIPVEPGSRVDLGDIVLQRGAALWGVVLDSSARPVPGARVYAVTKTPSTDSRFNAKDPIPDELALARGERATETNQEGTFSFSGLDMPQLVLYVEAAGFEPARRRYVEVGGPPVQLRVERAAIVLLEVLDKATGQPVIGAVVRAYRQTGIPYETRKHSLEVLAGLRARQLSETTGSPEGFFVVRGIGPVRTHVHVSAKGYATRGFVVSGAAPTESLTRTVHLEREARVAGRVTNDDGQPVIDATVSLASPDAYRVPLPERTETSDATGRYAFTALYRGDWKLTAIAPGYVATEPRTVAVKAGEVHDDVNVVLKSGAGIQGTILDTQGSPAVGTLVWARPEDADKPRSPLCFASDRDGRFAFVDLVPSQWRISADPGARATVELKAGETAQVQLRLRARPVVRGRVLAGGQPVAGAAVQLSRVTRSAGKAKRYRGGGGSATSGDDGTFELTAYRPGEFGLTARHPSGGLAPRVDIQLDWGGAESADVFFDTGRVEGLVLEATTAEGAPGVTVELRRDQDEHDRVARVQSGEDGRFLIDFLEPGTYSGSCRGGGYLNASFGPVVVGSGASVTDVRVQVSRGATLKGRVQTPAGSAVEDASFVVVADPTDFSSWREVNTTEAGFEFTGLTPGEYRVIALTWEWGMAHNLDATKLGETRVTLGPGEVRELTLIVSEDG